MLCVWFSGACKVTFERIHHQFIAQVLHALDGPMLREFNCLFGGGTAIALRYGEYRESVDIDFLVSDVQSYRGLRQSLAGPSGIKAIMRDVAAPFDSGPGTSFGSIWHPDHVVGRGPADQV